MNGKQLSTVVASLVGLALLAGAAQARPLEDIERRGILQVCAHPNALPFASRKGEPRGIQLDLARVIAERLGVRLSVDWVILSYQMKRADCDMVMGTIADREALKDSRLKVSRPYFRSGVVLAVRPELDGIAGLEDLEPAHRIGVMRSSIAHMTLEQRGLTTIPFAFEDEMMAAVASGDIDMAAVTPISAGWFLRNNPELGLRLLDIFADSKELNWNLAVGMRRSDRFLRRKVNGILEDLIATGELAELYARYGIAYRPPDYKKPFRVKRKTRLGEQECVRLGYSRQCAR